MKLSDINRRKFLKQSGQVLVGFNLLPLAFCTPNEANVMSDFADKGKNAVDSWIRLNPDGKVTVLTGKMELGQGIKAALRQIAAEELDVGMDMVEIVIADTGKTQDERYTAGSNSIEGSGKTIRNAAAEARRILLEKAAGNWNTSPEELSIDKGMISQPGGKSASFWDVLQEKSLEGEITEKAPKKDPKDYKVIGQPVPREDILAMVTGKSLYVQDLRLPGMIHARVMRPPSYGAKLIDFPKEEVEGLPGVIKTVKDGSFLAVLAEREFDAIKGLQRLQMGSRWEEKTLAPPQDELYEKMFNSHDKGDSIEDSLPSNWQERGEILEAAYTRPFQMHGSIGPSCAIAQMENGKLTVWSHTQGVYPMKRTIADLLGMSEDNIRVIGVPGSGCYGHNGADDAGADAALLAAAHPGPPIRVQWMRMDEHSWEPYGSAMAFKMIGIVDSAGNIEAWRTELWSDAHSARPGGKAGHFIAANTLENPRNFEPGGFSAGSYRNAVPLYGFPREIVHHDFSTPLRTSAMRGLGAYGNVFALESFMDELAHKSGADPLEMRLKHLHDERAKEVLEMLAEKINWSSNRKKGNQGWGLAFAKYKNAASYFAVAALVEADPVNKDFKLQKMVGVIDAGQTINLDGLKNQTEGGMIQSASWTLFEEVKYDSQGIVSNTWASYPIMRFSHVPEIEVHVIDRPEEEPLGAGEAAQGPVSAAIANAIFEATGSRLRDLPLKPEQINWDKLQS
ncbi:xanthine dehydrogenase family protein molybdopterin-binding subunit [Litoribacter ruber]|uniref:xanthine dehydrogenase family protein molybdopterin-binding subunit n=1 Tax=Litoribacter ruber TaxID=702568 RepID=UPI001BD9B002|nr:molybdopterin cofactor-binding domain-containing protein [Litoribacter ruber]MBT0811246.1 xanthine dehydrogenase family protein molybdopterin-binding subunit [Litoribacter ruber]